LFAFKRKSSLISVSCRSVQVLELPSMPKVVTLIGGGYIGMEFAGMFARLGCEVHVIARQELPLAPRFDKEVTADLQLAHFAVCLIFQSGSALCALRELLAWIFSRQQLSRSVE
jgi:glutathione reductase (NADPH)